MFGPETALDASGLKALMQSYEKELILTALNASGWHQRRAAASLGVLPTTLHEKMKRLGIHAAFDVPEEAPADPVAGTGTANGAGNRSLATLREVPGG